MLKLECVLLDLLAGMIFTVLGKALAGIAALMVFVTTVSVEGLVVRGDVLEFVRVLGDNALVGVNVLVCGKALGEMTVLACGNVPEVVPINEVFK